MNTAAKGWFEENEGRWASCPITQSGYVRTVMREGYPNTISMGAAFEKLSDVVSKPNHKFLPDDTSLLNQNLVAHEHIQGAQPVD